MSAKSTNYNLKVTHGPFCHEIQVPSTATFGDVKQILVEDTLLQPSEQRLLFRGREVADVEGIIEAGVKNGMKLMLLENLAGKERKEEEFNKAAEAAKASSAIAQIHVEVDKYQSQVQELRDTVSRGVKVDEKQCAIISELLMRQLLKLDGIDAEGEVKQQRRNEVKRVQQLVDEVDRLKGKASLAGPTDSQEVRAPRA